MVSQILKKTKIIPILRYFTLNDLEDKVNILIKYNIKALEISLTNPLAFDAIKILKNKFANVLIGAGTVITKEQVLKLKKINIDFIFSPGTTIELLETCKENKIEFIPGVFSPSDIMLGYSYGIRYFKIFPISEISKNFIKVIKGPFYDIKFLGVGGIEKSNIYKYLKIVNSVGVGSYLFPKETNLSIYDFTNRVKGITND